MSKKRTKQQKIKAQQRRPDQIALLQSQYQFTAAKTNSRSSSFAPAQPAKILKATDLFRYDTKLIYRDITKTFVITIIMVIALVIISRFVQ